MISATMSLFHETIPPPDEECAAIAIGDKWAETAAMTLQDPDKELETGRKAARLGVWADCSSVNHSQDYSAEQSTGACSQQSSGAWSQLKWGKHTGSMVFLFCELLSTKSKPHLTVTSGFNSSDCGDGPH